MVVFRVRCKNGHVFRVNRPEAPTSSRCSWCRRRVQVSPLPPELQFNARVPEKGRYYAVARREYAQRRRRIHGSS